ncbi:MAG: transcription-repair coupling factor [Magnetococcales bacterium]|nr:transcription-repair coupling factor [Magnetococcales bacterium]MBF0116037.1 transcription-repair coupling factor [Magnetococcales bacterium]
MDPQTLSHPLLSPLKPYLAQRGSPFPVLCDLPGGSFAWLATALAREWPRPLVLVSSSSSRAEALYREVLFFSEYFKQPLPLLSFPAWETMPFEPLSPFGPLVGERISTLFRLTQMTGSGPVLAGTESGATHAIIVTTAAALMQRVMPAQQLAQHGLAIKKGDQLNLTVMREFLHLSGYRHASQVVEPGEFAIRGGIIDFFPPGHENPVRIELFGDEVETLRQFDPVTQRSTDPIPGVQALPTSEVLLNENTIRSFRTQYRQLFGGQAADDTLYKELSKGIKVQGMEHFLPLFYEPAETFFDYLPEGSTFLLEEDALPAVAQFEQEVQERHRLVGAPPEGRSGLPRATGRHLPADALYLTLPLWQEALQRFTVFESRHGAEKGGVSLAFDGVVDFITPSAAAAVNDAGGKANKESTLDRVAHHIRTAQKNGFRIALTVRTIGQRERLREVLEDHKISTRLAPHWEGVLTGQPGSTWVVIGDVEQGFAHGRIGVLLIPEEAIFGRRTRRRQRDQRYLEQLLASFSDLQEGNLVVHADHGIGRFGGLQPLAIGTIKNEFLLISYQDEDKLYVPVENLDRVSKYSGSEEIALDKLGSAKWEKTKERTRKKILEMAHELVHLQALRAATEGFTFAGADPLYQEFAATFPFEETPDQAQAIEAVLQDMASSRPMDRLVCGDVGFGKTEVALRAAFRAVMDGKQVAVLAPTTILAQQHFETFSRRLAPYPVKLELLSRFRSPLEQKQALRRLSNGEAEIAIGTHRLLQSDVHFKDIGLLVVDEEQRFGVSHKEKLKSFRATVDILTLTATPIPRTLHLAMAGVRDISIIATPPLDRLAIRTIITQYDRTQVREAILREIYRGGQVYYLYNRVQDIEKFAAQLGELVPEAKLGVAHGQMREGQLERIMFSFYQQEFNVLLCTTIIENGVDIPSANTIIIHRADKFGLAQLHQLRGRVGRSKHRAYAYLLVPPAHNLTEDARKRLDALESLGDLGAGFSLATHDLEIRGAGNILGDEQSGQIREVGFELYNQMLREAIQGLAENAVAQEKPERPEEIIPNISLHVSTHIPHDFVPDVHQRLTLYKRIAELNSAEEILEMRSELLDRFGPLPESITNLLRLVGIKRSCRQLRILKLDAGPKGASLQFHPQPSVNPQAIIELIQQGGGAVIFNHQTNALVVKNRLWDVEEVRLRALEELLERLRPDPAAHNKVAEKAPPVAATGKARIVHAGHVDKRRKSV